MDTTNTYRLGASDLQPGEAILVQTLLKLFACGSPFRWTFVDKPPYDALLVDGSMSKADASAEMPAGAILRLTRRGDLDAPNTLQRPIRAERLRAWLTGVERKLRADGLPAFSAAPTHGNTLAGQAYELSAQAGDIRFKLRRWPPAITLRGDGARIRMATLLSRRALSADELSRLSRKDIAECSAFLTVLKSAGLVEQMSDALLAKTVEQAVKPTPFLPKIPFGRGLVAGIRRRLGL